MRFVRSSTELVHKIWRLKFRRLIQWIRSGECHVYVSIADTDTTNFRFAFSNAKWETSSLFLTREFFANHEKPRGLLISHGEGEEELSIHSRMSCLKDAFLTARETLNILPAFIIREASGCMQTTTLKGICEVVPVHTVKAYRGSRGITPLVLNPYPTAFPYGNGMVLHFYQQQESSTTKTVHKVINKGLKTYV